MKRYLIALFSMVILFASCKKDNEQVFSQSPDERIAATMTAFQNKLAGNTDGWKVVVNPITPGSYAFYMKFNNQNRVTMMADISDSTASVFRESSYRLKALQQPAILFDTYNYLHILMDPTPAISGSVAGAGLVSDIEYYFPTPVILALNGKQPDTITTMSLTGRLNGAEMIFTKATSAEAAAYAAGNLKTFRASAITYLQAQSFLLSMDFGDGVKVMVIVNSSAKTALFIWLKGGQIFSFSTGFSFALDGLLLRAPFVYNNTSIVTKLTWDGTKLTGVGSGTGVPAVVQTTATPVIPFFNLFGSIITGVNLPRVTTFPGWSTDYKSRRAAAASAMLTGGYGLTLGQMDYAGINSSSFTINVDIFQGANGFLAQFPYTYSKTSGGVYKFTAGPVSGNASIIIGNMAPLFAQRLDVDNFTLDYFSDPVEGSLAKFTSVQHPDFVFTGRMR